MCNPVSIGMSGFSAVSQIGGYFAQKKAAQARNRARLLNFREANKRYYSQALLDNVQWRNTRQDNEIANDNLFQQLTENWRQQDLAREQAYDQHALYNVEVLKELYQKEYAGTQTGVTAMRLANEGARQVGMALTKSQRQVMMVDTKTSLAKEIALNDTNRRIRAGYQKTWRSPVAGHTPTPPALEGGPSMGGLLLGLAATAVGGMYSGEVGIFAKGGKESTSALSQGFNTNVLSPTDNPALSFVDSGNMSSNFFTQSATNWSSTIQPSTNLLSNLPNIPY